MVDIIETPKPQYLIVDSDNFDKIHAAILVQKPFIAYCNKVKHPTKDIYNIPINYSFDIDWTTAMANATYTEVIELDADWIVVPEKLN